MARLASAAEWAEIRAWIDALNHDSAPSGAREEAPMRPAWYRPSESATIIAPEVDAPAREFTAGERALLGTPVDHRRESHPAQREARIAALMRERVSTCG